MTTFSVKKCANITLKSTIFTGKLNTAIIVFHFVIDNGLILSVRNKNLISALSEMDGVSAQTVL